MPPTGVVMHPTLLKPIQHGVTQSVLHFREGEDGPLTVSPSARILEPAGHARRDAHAMLRWLKSDILRRRRDRRGQEGGSRSWDGASDQHYADSRSYGEMSSMEMDSHPSMSSARAESDTEDDLLDNDTATTAPGKSERSRSGGKPSKPYEVMDMAHDVLAEQPTLQHKSSRRSAPFVRSYAQGDYKLGLLGLSEANRKVPRKKTNQSSRHSSLSRLGSDGFHSSWPNLVSLDKSGDLTCSSRLDIYSPVSFKSYKSRSPGSNPMRTSSPRGAQMARGLSRDPTLSMDWLSGDERFSLDKLPHPPPSFSHLRSQANGKPPLDRSRSSGSTRRAKKQDVAELKEDREAACQKMLLLSALSPPPAIDSLDGLSTYLYHLDL